MHPTLVLPFASTASVSASHRYSFTTHRRAYCPFRRHTYRVLNRRHLRVPLCSSQPDEHPLPLPISDIVIGLNQYSHDASLAIVASYTSDSKRDSSPLVFAISKERLSRRKHDAGDLASVVYHAIDALACQYNVSRSCILNKVSLVVANNHHFRIAPFEKNLMFHVHARYSPKQYLSPWNLIGTAYKDSGDSSDRLAPNAKKIELSHHLAHAYSAIHDAPFDNGVVVVMDGMGDALDEWLRSKIPNSTPSISVSHGDHFTELSIPDVICKDHPCFVQFPVDVLSRPGTSFREAESAYLFQRHTANKTIRLQRIFKRWTPENSPSELTNHSFEDMDSLGALYSRVSSIIFTDWNVCGKVMGLAPYGERHQSSLKKQSKTRFFIHGNIHDGTLDADRARDYMSPQPKFLYDVTQNDTSARESQESFAYQVQHDIEDIILNFMEWLVSYSGVPNVAFVGGVALNSCVNSKINDLPCVSSLYVPPYPGDEGISVGCATFGNLLLTLCQNRTDSTLLVEPPRKFARMPFLGRNYSIKDIKEAVHCFAPWVHWTDCDGARNTASAIADGAIVGWFDGPSEFGPRALGHRSLLADPRHKWTGVKMNAEVKKREPFRPFAPVVLNQFRREWFCDVENVDSSRFMAMTRMVMPQKRDIIPAVVHVDGSARLQTVCVDEECDKRDIGEFGRVLSEFQKLTDVPILLNTSFNVAGEAIVESPHDAIRTLLRTPSITMLGFAHGTVRRKIWTCANLDDKIGSGCAWLRISTVSGGSGSTVHANVEWAPIYWAELDDENDCDDDDANSFSYVPERTECALLIDELQVSILERVHMMQNCTVRLLIQEFCDDSGDDEHCKSSESNSDNEAEYDNGTEEVDSVSTMDVVERLVDLHEKLLIFSYK